ncbi:MAG: hypothetical protein EPN85_00890 [Bacteroidetes bacterium]|nr:MAG: hypothetical protein EPN85_00890 [Bacteroidota bacterium]
MPKVYRMINGVTAMGNLIYSTGDDGGAIYSGGSYYPGGKYLGANKPTFNKLLPYLHFDAVCLVHRRDSLIDNKFDNIHVTRKIQGFRFGILFRLHPINDEDNADSGTASDSIIGEGVTGSIADDGTLWGGAYYSSTDITGKTMTSFHYMPPSSSNIFIPSVAIGYGFLKYIDNYIPADADEDLKVVDCPPGKRSGHRTFINYYADILIGYPYVQAYKDAEGHKHHFTPGKSIGYTREYIGFRVGMEYNYGRKQNITTKIELARYPDLLTYYDYNDYKYDYDNLCYINIRIGIGLFRASKYTINKMGQLVNSLNK